MTVVNILIAAVVLGLMGLLFGLLLMGTEKAFAIPADEKRDAVRAALPGANCGACGYPGCDGCADAIACGKAPVNACPVGGKPVADKISAIMGNAEAADAVRKVASVICQGDSEHCKEKFEYRGIQDCVAASVVNDGNKACKFACLGLGTCTRVCPFDAIHVDPVKKIAVVDDEKCVACGKCVAICPKGVLSLRPVTEDVTVRCRNTEPAKKVLSACSTGCIHCGKCFRSCPHGAITMTNGLPVIDQSKCQHCMACADACPTKAMWANFDKRKVSA